MLSLDFFFPNAHVENEVHCYNQRLISSSFIYMLKWRILSQPAKIGSGKNKKIFIFPTGLEDHLEDMF
jgi:hypothetical protein